MAENKSYKRPDHEYDRHRHLEMTRAKALREAAGRLGNEHPIRANQLLNEASLIDGLPVKPFEVKEKEVRDERAATADTAGR